MSSYKLTYFNYRAKAEVSRYMFKLKDVPFEDNRIDGNWKEVKPSTPFGQLPVLEFDGHKICQTLAIERLIANRLGLYGSTEFEKAKSDMVVGCLEDVMQAMLRDTAFFEKDLPAEEKALKRTKFVEEKFKTMLTNMEKLLNSDGYYVGKELMWPDIAVAHVLSWIDVVKLDVDLATAYPGLHTLKQRVETQPKIAAWIKCRPETTV